LADALGGNKAGSGFAAQTAAPGEDSLGGKGIFLGKAGLLDRGFVCGGAVG